MTRKNFVGFYWTLQVPWVSFTDLPQDVDAAAEASRTIRYQRDLVRRWVKDNGGTLVAERVFLELAPDRASEYVMPAINELAKLCSEKGLELVHVDFQDRHHSRPHPFLRDALARARIDALGLKPEPIMIDGETFDPIEHFREWSKLKKAHVEGKPAVAESLRGEIHRLREYGCSWKRVADDLNARGLKTLNGKPWTSDNLRKFAAG